MMLWEGDYMDKWTRLRDALYEMQDHLSDENYHLYENVIDEITLFDDWDFKCRLAELLASVNNQHAFHTLLQLAQDRNPLVQVDALDALSSYPSLVCWECPQRIDLCRCHSLTAPGSRRNPV